MILLEVSHVQEGGLLLGTDVPNPFVFPGASLHEELQICREAGISSAQILELATAAAAHFLGEGGRSGEVSVGARADLLLLDGDPESDFSVLREPVAGMAAGRLCDSSALSSLREDVARCVSLRAGAAAPTATREAFLPWESWPI